MSSVDAAEPEGAATPPVRATPPALRLPPELLSRCAEEVHALSLAANVDRHKRRRSLQQAKSFNATCGVFHEAMSPLLFKYLRLQFWPKELHETEDKIAYLHRRSLLGTVLSLSIELGRRRSMTASQLATELETGYARRASVLDTMLPHCTRLREVGIRLSGEALLDVTVLARLAQHAPTLHLETCELVGAYGATSPEVIVAAKSFFRSASTITRLSLPLRSARLLVPLLESLPDLQHLRTNPFSLHGLDVVPPLQLRSLSVADGDCQLGVLLDILRATAATLVCFHLHAHFRQLDDDMASAFEPFPLPSLRHIHLSAAAIFTIDITASLNRLRPTLISIFLRYLDQPSLTTLKLGVLSEGVDSLLRLLAHRFAAPDDLRGCKRVTLMLNEGTSEFLVPEAVTTSSEWGPARAAAEARGIELEIRNEAYTME